MVVHPDNSDRIPAVSRRGVVVGGGTVGAGGLVTSLHATPAAARPAAAYSADRQPTPSDLVAVKHGSFWPHGKPVRFGGPNCYYLHQQSHYLIDAVLNDAAAMSVPVVRASAFADGTGTSALLLRGSKTVTSEQPAPGVDNGEALALAPA